MKFRIMEQASNPIREQLKTLFTIKRNWSGQAVLWSVSPVLGDVVDDLSPPVDSVAPTSTTKLASVERASQLV